MANQVGKRYACTVCGGEVVVTKGSDAEIRCCAKPMAQK